MKNVVSSLQGTLFESPIFLSWHYGYNKAVVKSIQLIEAYQQSEPTMLIMQILNMRYMTEDNYHVKVPRCICKWDSQRSKYVEYYNPRCILNNAQYGGAYYGFTIVLKVLANHGYYASVLKDGEVQPVIYR